MDSVEGGGILRIIMEHQKNKIGPWRTRIKEAPPPLISLVSFEAQYMSNLSP